MPRLRNTGAVHAMGNGRFLVYGQGIALSGLIGPPYTAPSFGAIVPESDDRVWTTVRIPGTDCRRHTAPDGSVMTDCVDPVRSLFCRLFSLKSPLRLRVSAGEGAELRLLPEFAGHPAIALRIPMGTSFFVSLAAERERWLFVSGRSVDISPDGGLLLSGEGELLLAAGIPPEAEADLRAAAGADILADAVRAGHEFAAGLRPLGEPLPAYVPNELRRECDEAGEDTAFLIRAQQSAEGGEAAGHCYPLSYVRDTAGTVRGMLSLGMYPEAERAVRFWASRHAAFGDVRNAEGMGHHGGRLRFPNDCSEVPGYILVTTLLVAERTGNDELPRELWPMLSWAMDAQLPLLGHGMLPFSGDETYIAGGTLPRIHTCDGSAEATLLFRMGAERMESYARAHGLPFRDGWREAAGEVSSLYRENFVRDGRLLCNAPERLRYKPKPEYNEGFCEVHDILRHELRLGWNRYDPSSGYYCCPDCFGRPFPPQTDLDTRYQLSSASLLPALYRDCFFSRDELDGFLEPYAALFSEHGFVPSNSEGSRSLGYDYGLFLAAAARSERFSSLRVPALRALLDVRDESGAWVEYYDRGRPAGCRCRPWESGLNVTAIETLASAD